MGGFSTFSFRRIYRERLNLGKEHGKIKRIGKRRRAPSSLAEAAGISRVQFSINGSANVKFRDSISLDTQFERNLDYIGGE